MSFSDDSPKRQVLYKFILLLMIFGGYFVYLSYKFDLLTGGMAALITWSFFVLCTPVADAGFLLDFPLRLLFGIRMIISEIVVWGIAISINLFGLLFKSHYYQTTFLTKLAKIIFTTPYPYWAVIILSAMGTFLSIHFGDELMDVVHHKERHFFLKNNFKYELVLFVFFLFVILGYYQLMVSLGLNISEPS